MTENRIQRTDNRKWMADAKKPGKETQHVCDLLFSVIC